MLADCALIIYSFHWDRDGFIDLKGDWSVFLGISIVDWKTNSFRMNNVVINLFIQE